MNQGHLSPVVSDIFHNKILLVTLAVWAIAQTLKVLLGILRERRFNFKWFIGTGGMPSSHAAGATALATACGLEYGFSSVYFALAAVFALVTMFDAASVRRSVGKQAIIMNKLIDEFYVEGKFSEQRVREFLGHTPVEVLIGAALGIGVSILYCIW